MIRYLSELKEETYRGITRKWLGKESDVAKFKGLVQKNGLLKAKFSHVNDCSQFLNADGRHDVVVYPKATSLQKRRENILKQGLMPDETDKAIAEFECLDSIEP